MCYINSCMCDFALIFEFYADKGEDGLLPMQKLQEYYELKVAMKRYKIVREAPIVKDIDSDDPTGEYLPVGTFVDVVGEHSLSYGMKVKLADGRGWILAKHSNAGVWAHETSEDNDDADEGTNTSSEGENKRNSKQKTKKKKKQFRMGVLWQPPSQEAQAATRIQGMARKKRSKPKSALRGSCCRALPFDDGLPVDASRWFRVSAVDLYLLGGEEEHFKPLGKKEKIVIGQLVEVDKKMEDATYFNRRIFLHLVDGRGWIIAQFGAQNYLTAEKQPIVLPPPGPTTTALTVEEEQQLPVRALIPEQPRLVVAREEEEKSQVASDIGAIGANDNSNSSGSHNNHNDKIDTSDDGKNTVGGASTIDTTPKVEIVANDDHS